ASDPQARERAGTGAERDRVELAGADPRRGEQALEHRQGELGMARRGPALERRNLAIGPERDRAPLGGGLDRRETHPAILCLIEFPSRTNPRSHSSPGTASGPTWPR